MTRSTTKHHPAPMFSFIGNTVFDPFCGTGSPMIACICTGRTSIGIEIDPEQCRMTARCLKAETSGLPLEAKLLFKKLSKNKPSPLTYGG